MTTNIGWRENHFNRIFEIWQIILLKKFKFTYQTVIAFLQHLIWGDRYQEAINVDTHMKKNALNHRYDANFLDRCQFIIRLWFPSNAPSRLSIGRYCVTNLVNWIFKRKYFFSTSSSGQRLGRIHLSRCQLDFLPFFLLQVLNVMKWMKVAYRISPFHSSINMLLLRHWQFSAVASPVRVP